LGVPMTHPTKQASWGPRQSGSGVPHPTKPTGFAGTPSRRPGRTRTGHQMPRPVSGRTSSGSLKRSCVRRERAAPRQPGRIGQRGAPSGAGLPGLGLLGGGCAGLVDAPAHVIPGVLGSTEVRWYVGADHLPLLVGRCLDLCDVLSRQMAEPALQLQVLDHEVLLFRDEVVVGARLGVVLPDRKKPTLDDHLAELDCEGSLIDESFLARRVDLHEGGAAEVEPPARLVHEVYRVADSAG